MQTCVKYTSTEQVFSSWLSHWRTGGQGHQGPVGWALQFIQHVEQKFTLPRSALASASRGSGTWVMWPRSSLPDLPAGFTAFFVSEESPT